MKINNRNKTDYFRMKVKVCINMLLVLMLTAIITFTIYKVLSGKISVVLVRIIQFTLQISYEGALNIYTKVFRNNSIMLIYISLLIVFIILFHFSLSWFGKYFDNINQGIDALVDGNKEYIKMPYELRSVEEKLNTVRNTLETQKSEAILAEQFFNSLYTCVHIIICFCIFTN